MSKPLPARPRPSRRHGRDVVPGLGVRLQHLRDRRGWNQTAAVAACQLNVSTLSRLEGDRVGCTCPTLIDIARGYKVSTDWLLGLSNEQMPRWE